MKYWLIGVRIRNGRVRDLGQQIDLPDPPPREGNVTPRHGHFFRWVDTDMHASHSDLIASNDASLTALPV